MVVNKILFALLATLVAPLFVDAENKYPIVFVHGLFGWNSGELFDVPYWGMFQGNFPQMLRDDGFEVYTVGVGKVSSDWDRAVELYYQIKGGRVDYGVNHSKRSGHARHGRKYQGLFPEWGTIVNGQLQKIHLMGHSMGGSTIRMLAHLLNKGVAGSPTPEDLDDPDTSDLFRGGKDWVHSITTISTPNQGTTLSDIFMKEVDAATGASSGIPDKSGRKALMNAYEKLRDSFNRNAKAGLFGILQTNAAKTAVSTLLGALGDSSMILYDPVLDQWGLNASLSQFWGTQDNAGYSLSTAGAKFQNSWVKTLPNVYYYSFVSDATFAWRDLLLHNIALPDPRFMSQDFVLTSVVMGGDDTTKLGYTASWLQNDGCVNVPSQLGDGVAPVIEFNGLSKRGTWVTFKPLAMDHMGTMGRNRLVPVYDIYRTHAAIVSDLPAQEDPDADNDVHRAPYGLVIDMQKALEDITVESWN